MKPTIIIGGGGHARSVISSLKQRHENIAGYVSIAAGPPILGVECIDERDEYRDFRLAVGVGFTADYTSRMILIDDFIKKKASFIPIIAHNSWVDGAVIGVGAYIGLGVNLSCGSRIGDFAIINTGAIVDHDTTIGSHAHVAPGATICGGCVIGLGCMVGVGSTIIQGITIAPGTIIGAGSTVVEDIKHPGIYYGAPAKLGRKLQ